jgi:hypothetical protein
MSKAIYIKEVNKMREIPDPQAEKNIENSFGVNDGHDCLFDSDGCGKAMEEYYDSLKEYPCPTQHSFEEGKVYEEDKDYMLVEEYNSITEENETIAIPINKESDDEMWGEVGKIVMDGYDYSNQDETTAKLKDLFNISRKHK